MTDQPGITTDRLLLRPFRREDAQVVQKLAGDVRIADTTQNIPHPYEDGMAEEWINGHEAHFGEGTQAVFAITLRVDERLAGAIGLTISPQDQYAELGYWVGVPFWNRGIATEAVVAMLDYGFSKLGLSRITAWHLLRNPASGRVMEKAGMRLDEHSRRIARKGDREEPLTSCFLLREDWESARDGQT